MHVKRRTARFVEKFSTHRYWWHIQPQDAICGPFRHLVRLLTLVRPRRHRHLRDRYPARPCRSPVRPPRPTRIRLASSLAGLLLLESTEPHLLLRVDQVDCAHGEFREAVRASDRAPQRARITRVHSAVADFLPVFIDVGLAAFTMTAHESMTGNSSRADDTHCPRRRDGGMLHDGATDRLYDTAALGRRAHQSRQALGRDGTHPGDEREC